MQIFCFTPVRNLYLNTLVAIHQLVWPGPLAWMQWRSNSSPDGRVNVLNAYRLGRALCLTGEWDAMLCVENDIVPPRDALQRLAAVEADVAYGLYCYRQPGHVWNAYCNGYQLSGKPAEARAAWGNVCEVEGYGLGCTLIHRRVLEKIEFRIKPGDALHCDSHFAEDVKKAGFRQMCDLGVRCGHVVNHYRIVWPDIEQPKLYRYSFEEVRH
jgi:hypothetical protein